MWAQYKRKESMLMDLAFLITWAPFGLVYASKLLGLHKDEATMIQSATSKVIPLLTAKCGCALLSPVVYGFENSLAPIVSKY